MEWKTLPQARRDGGKKGEGMKGRRVEEETKASLVARSKGRRGKRERDVRGTETHALLHNVIDPPVVMPQVTEVEGVHMHM